MYFVLEILRAILFALNQFAYFWSSVFTVLMRVGRWEWDDVHEVSSAKRNDNKVVDNGR